MIGKQTLAFESINTVKAEFDAIYSRPDPRDYFGVLYGLNYVIPEVARGVFRNLVETLARSRGRRPIVLDIGCSYGINAALLKSSVDIDRLAHRYRDLSLQDVTPAEVRRLDQHYFASWPRDIDATIIGLDISQPAVDYACAVGLLDGGIVRDLETGQLSASERQMLANVDLIISTGCIGYVTERTLSKVLACTTGPKPWAANFVLRMFPFGPVQNELQDAGLVTEKLDGVTFAQRRFHSKAEQAGVLKALHQLGINTTEKEAAGAYHAELFLSRPPKDIKAHPLDQVVSISSGIDGHVTDWQRWH